MNSKRLEQVERKYFLARARGCPVCRRPCQQQQQQQTAGFHLTHSATVVAGSAAVPGLSSLSQAKYSGTEHLLSNGANSSKQYVIHALMLRNTTSLYGAYNDVDNRIISDHTALINLYNHRSIKM